MPTPKTQLAALNTDAKAIYADIQYFVTPLDEVHGLLSQVQDLLKKPEDFDKKLGDIFQVLRGLEKACKSGSWIPEVGTLAKGAGEFIAGINGFIKPTRDILSQIERDIKPLQDWIRKLQKPVDRAWGAVGNVEGKIEALANVTDSLRKHYKDAPPKGLENCAAVLNRPLHPVTQTLNDAKDEANAGLNTVEQPLRQAWNALGRLLDYANVIDKAYNALGGLRSFINTITAAVTKAANYGKKAIEDAISWVGRHTFPKTYKKVKAMMDEVDRQIAKMRKSLTDFLFKPVQDMVARVARDIENRFKALPAVKALKAAVGQVEAALETVLHAIENQADPCRDMLSGKQSPGG
ncbi:hypothetical protein [uncultured Roseobacter sp.]|uniref:hypothetical protein n=1 Tax=uncultured Roseobacter sp. TaxID=114847 RepID=UPI002625CD03|nr:hypothetical protein [uncultured Roseobacter sp.]